MLARLEAFLPEMKRANETLDAAEANIEQEEPEEEEEGETEAGAGGPRIEMVSSAEISA